MPLDVNSLDVEVWPENWPVIEMLSMVQWQWITGGMTAVQVGVEHQSAWAMLDNHPEAPTDKAGRWDVFEELQIAAGECLKVWRG